MGLLPVELKRSSACIPLVVAGLLAGACGGTGAQPQATSVPEPLPEGAVAFRYDRHLYFDGAVCDSLSARLVFDTGATGLYVDSLWFAQSGFTPSQPARGCVGGAGTGISQVRILFDKIRFGIDTLQWQSEMTPVLALKEVLGRHADGIFGQQYMAHDCVEFNLGRGYLRAVSPDTLASAGFTRIGAEKRSDRIYIPAQVRFDSLHTVAGLFLLDMGSPGTVSVTTPAARRAGFDSFPGKKVPYNTVSGGIGGGSDHIYCRAGAVSFGDRTFADVPVEVSRNEAGFLSRDDIAGLIGNGLLERFDFVIDFAAPALWVRPAAGCEAPFPFVSSGFSAIDRTDICEGWPVTGLYEGYAPAGLRPGDVVVEWDGMPVGGLRIDSALNVPGVHRAGILRNGERMEYRLETKEIL